MKLETMTDEIREKFSIKTTYSQTCNVNSSHNLCRHFTHNVSPISTDDVLDKHLFLNSQEFDVIQVIKHKLTLDNFVSTSKCPVLVEDNSIANSANSACVIIPKPSTCGAMLRQSVAVINTADIFFVSYTHSPTKKYTLTLDNGYVMEINNCTYQISGIVYLKSYHYWCEIYSTQKNCKNGWFVHNG